MIDLPNQLTDLNKLKANAYLNGVRAEREKVLEELKRIHEFPEMGAREQLKDFIIHLEKKE